MAKKNFRNYTKELAQVTTNGKKYIDSLLAEHGDVSIKNLGNLISDNKNAKAILVRWMMRNANVSVDRLAMYYGCSAQALRNKIVRNSFSFEDLLICAYACDCSFQLKNNSATEEDILTINPLEYFRQDDTTDIDENIIERITRIHDEISAKEREYNELKEKLEVLKSEYGFK